MGKGKMALVKFMMNVSSDSEDEVYDEPRRKSRRKGAKPVKWSKRIRRASKQSTDQFNYAMYGPHPLLIPEVVADIMNRLQLSDLRNARLVCKAWTEEATRVLPTKGRIHLSTFQDVTDFISSFEDSTDSRYKFTHFRFGQHLNLQEPLIQRFFNKFGSHIEYLHFDWTHWIPASLRRILFEKLPVLEELIICSQRLCENVRVLPSTSSGENKQILLPNIKILRIEGEFDSSSGQFILDLVSVMPNLKIISEFSSPKTPSMSKPTLSRLGILRYEQWDSYTDRLSEDNDLGLMFSRILLRNAPRKLMQLENLKLLFNFNNIMLFARQIDYQLKSLELVIPGYTFLPATHQRPTILHSFILSFSKTLTSLKLTYCSGRPNILSTFDGIGRLKYLRHLTLHRVTGPLDFLNCLPQLKSLYMTQEDFIEHYDEFHIDECRPHKLQTLKLYYTNWSASSSNSELPRPAKILNVVGNIVQRFPHLTSFRMETLTDKALNVIYCNLPQLEELEATNGIFTSVGISGIPVINQGQSLFARKQPFIGCLKNLRKLRLESNKFTDYGIYSSVVLLTGLEELSLLCYKITDESLLTIVKRMRLKFLKTEFCYEFTESAILKATRKMNKRGADVQLNKFCGSMEVEKIHDYLNENGPIHVSMPAFPVDG